MQGKLLSRQKQPYPGMARLFKAVYGSSCLLPLCQERLDTIHHFFRSQLGDFCPEALCGGTNKLADYFRPSVVPDRQLGTVALNAEPDKEISSLKHGAQCNYLPSWF